MKIGSLFIAKKVLAGITILVLTMAGLAMWRTTFAKSDNKPTEVKNEALPEYPIQTREVPAALVKLRLYDVGILPRQANVPAGNVKFAVEDFYGSECKIVIEQEETDKNKPLKKLGKIKDDQKTGRLRKVASFAPGRYWISMEDKPDNRMLLIVENPQ